MFPGAAQLLLLPPGTSQLCSPGRRAQGADAELAGRPGRSPRACRRAGCTASSARPSCAACRLRQRSSRRCRSPSPAWSWTAPCARCAPAPLGGGSLTCGAPTWRTAAQVLSTAFLAGQGPHPEQATRDWMWLGKDIAAVWPDLAGTGAPAARRAAGCTSSAPCARARPHAGPCTVADTEFPTFPETYMDAHIRYTAALQAEPQSRPTGSPAAHLRECHADRVSCWCRPQPTGMQMRICWSSHMARWAPAVGGWAPALMRCHFPQQQPCWVGVSVSRAPQAVGKSVTRILPYVSVFSVDHCGFTVASRSRDAQGDWDPWKLEDKSGSSGVQWSKR